MPIHKGGHKEEELNYRPVSLTSIVAKMCEKIVKDIWLKFLEETKHAQVVILDLEEEGLV